MAEIPSELPEELKPWVDTVELDEYMRAVFRDANAQIVVDTLATHISPGEATLEIGSGTGELAQEAPLSYQADYIQLDKRSEYARVNRFQHPEATIVVGNGSDLPIKDNSRDVVVGMNVLDRFSDLTQIFKEIQRVLGEHETFIHFHDRRPNIAFCAQQIPSDTIAFPLVRQGVLDNFQLVPRMIYETTGPHPRLANYVDVMKEDPEFLEAARNQFPVAVEAASNIVARTFGRIAQPRSFNQIFTDAITRALTTTGFEAVSIEHQTTEVVITRELGERVINRYALARVDGNVLEKDENGIFRLQEETAPGLAEDELLLRSGLYVVVARS